MPRSTTTTSWADIFIVVDDGTITIDEYKRVEADVAKQRARYPSGLGCLVILPPGANPPPDDVRKFISQMLDRLGITALAYVVEGTGFKGATTRAVLIGLGIFQRKPYPTHVTTTLSDAVKWLDAHLPATVQRKNAVIEVQRVMKDSFGR